MIAELFSRQLLLERDVWQTTNTHLFRTDTDISTDRTYCPNVDIESIEWQYTVGDDKICSYCKQEYEGAICPGCNGRSPERSMQLGSGTVSITGLLPKEGWLLDIRPTTLLEICYREVGRADQYDEDEVIIVLRNFEVIRKSIPAPVTFGQDKMSAMEAHVVVICDVELWTQEEQA